MHGRDEIRFFGAVVIVVLVYVHVLMNKKICHTFLLRLLRKLSLCGLELRSQDVVSILIFQVFLSAGWD